MMTPKWTGFPYFEAAGRGGKDAAAELGDTFVYAGADHADVALQVETLENFLPRSRRHHAGGDRPQAVAPVLKRPRGQGVVVTTFDADAATRRATCSSTSSPTSRRRKTMLDCALLDAPEGGEVAFVAASPTAPNHMAHIKYMKEFIANDPKYKVFTVVDTQYANDDDAKSYDVAINLMQAHPNLKVIISSSAVSAPAAARAIDRSGHAGKVFSTGFALPSAIKNTSSTGRKRPSPSGTRMNWAIWPPM